MTGRHQSTDRPRRFRRRPVPRWAWWAVLLAGGLAIALIGLIGLNIGGSTGQSGQASPAAGIAAAARSTTSGPSTSGLAAAGRSAPGGSAAGVLTAPVLPTGPAGAVAPQPAPVSTTSPPVRLVIAAIGVDTPLESLGVIADGSMQSPTQWGVAGWFSAGVRPGDTGPAIIAGHVDSRHGPAVFYHLRKLKAGDVADVLRQDGSVLHFVIDTVASYPKTEFPTTVVYGPTADPELRLITCTGEFDWTARSYLDNLVVSAHLTP